MNPMAIDRRELLSAAGGLLLAGGFPAGAAADRSTGLFAAARRNIDGDHSAAIFDATGCDIRSVELPARGHDLAVCPVTRRCVVFARRPGSFAVAFSADISIAPTGFSTPLDRHFYGHGVFSRDGRLLYATENDFEAGRGVIGIYYATADFRRIGELSSHGVGPHDIAMLRREPVLVVANGGLKEHPDIGRGRRVLNPEAIETSLVYIDPSTGDLLEKHQLGPGQRLSLRHLDIAHDDSVVIGAQQQGSAGNEPLVFHHARQRALLPFDLDPSIGERLAGYVTSLAIDSSGEFAAVTSARGNMVLLIEVATGRVRRTIRLDDVSGVAASGVRGAFLTATGHGRLTTIDPAVDAVGGARLTRWQWDNHAVALP
jgi:hypothetical protein